MSAICRRAIFGLVCLFVLALGATPVTAADSEAEPPDPPSMHWGDDDAYLQLLSWHQTWIRGMELNPGTEIAGNEEDSVFDIGMRRTRFLLFGEYEDMEFVFHFGADNQHFDSPDLDLSVIGAWGAYRLLDEKLTVGAGLHYWNGISRLTNNSSTSSLALDPPILNWPTIGGLDRVARQLGVFAKGQLGILDYRVALNRPFLPAQGPTDVDSVDFNAESNTLATTGYVQYFFRDSEPNLLPYLPSTRLGASSLLNVGVGWYWQPEGMAELQDDGELNAHDILALGADIFWEQPFDDGAALTAHLTLYHLDMGPDYVRNVGVMNIGEGGTSLNGPGNAYPTIGTGQHIYLQTGYLLAYQLGSVQIQPYLAGQLSAMEGLDDPVAVGNVGANWYIYGQTAKITTHLRNRPIFDEEGTTDSRAMEAIVQLQFAL